MMAQTLTEKYAYPVKPVCSFLDLASSSYYYVSKECEPQLKADLETVAGLYPTYGTRRSHTNCGVNRLSIGSIASAYSV